MCILRDNWPVIWLAWAIGLQERLEGRSSHNGEFSVMSRSRSQGTEVTIVTGDVLSSLLRIDWSVNPSLCLLNDDSGLCIGSMQKRMLFAGFTAAKKTIIQNWFTPHMCGKTCWIRSLLQIVTCECATARVGGARPSTIDAWQCFLFDIRDYIKEWLLCFYCPSLSSSLLTGLWDVEYVSVVLFCCILNVVLCYVWTKIIIICW